MSKSAKSKKTTIRIIAAVLCTLMLIPALASCNNNKELDLSGMYIMTYIGNGGFFESNMTTRELHYNVGDLINMPTTSTTGSEISKSTLGKISRKGYNLVGWYTAQSVTYTENADGDYIKVDAMYRRSGDGGYVLVYNKNEKGAYSLKVTEITNADGGATKEEEYVLFDPLDEKLAGFERYELEFVEYDPEKHEGLNRYDYVTEGAYAILDEILTQRYDGKYVKNEDDTYSYAAESDGGVRYGYLPEYVISADNIYDLPRYEASFIYDEADKWDFGKDRMPDHDVTIYAYWTPALTVTYIYWDNSSFSTYDNKVGSLISRPSGSAKDGNGRTFVGWSLTKDEYTPWDFNNDVYPVDLESHILYLYAYYIEGDYIRVTTATDFMSIAKNPSASYLLVNDIDLSDVNTYNTGFIKNDVVFTGVFNGFGNKITGLEITAVNKLIDTVPFAPFPTTQGATITDLIVEAVVSVSSRCMGPVIIAGFVGVDNGGTKLINCSGNVVFKSVGSVDVDVTYGTLFGKAKSDSSSENCTVVKDDSALSTSGTLKCSD